jgi:hypothetical protein
VGGGSSCTLLGLFPQRVAWPSSTGAAMATAAVRAVMSWASLNIMIHGCGSRTFLNWSAGCEFSVAGRTVRTWELETPRDLCGERDIIYFFSPELCQGLSRFNVPLSAASAETLYKLAQNIPRTTQTRAEQYVYGYRVATRWLTSDPIIFEETFSYSHILPHWTTTEVLYATLSSAPLRRKSMEMPKLNSIGHRPADHTLRVG